MNYILMFVNEEGKPDFSVSPIYQVNDVPEESLTAFMLNVTKIIEAIEILQPQRKVKLFQLAEVVE